MDSGEVVTIALKDLLCYQALVAASRALLERQATHNRYYDLVRPEDAVLLERATRRCEKILDKGGDS